MQISTDELFSGRNFNDSAVVVCNEMSENDGNSENLSFMLQTKKSEKNGH